MLGNAGGGAAARRNVSVRSQAVGSGGRVSVVNVPPVGGGKAVAESRRLWGGAAV